MPNYAWWEAPFYGIGMKVYDLLAGAYGFGKSRRLGRDEVLRRIPTLASDGLRGGVLYHDGQFDDARLLINLVTTAAVYGATVINYARVTGLTRDDGGRVAGVTAEDVESGEAFAVKARCVVNATGAFADAVRRLDDPAAASMIAPSQGVHIVLDRSFLPGTHAIMVPRTRDGRVMFAIPWHDRVVVGTTDTPIREASLEPVARDEEVDFLLDTAAQYLAKGPTRDDVLSVFTGIRPLVKGDAATTAALSRDHTIYVSNSGLVTIAGGKWTTYRKMAEDCVDQAVRLARLDERPCVTKTLRVHGHHDNAAAFGDLSYYGSDAPAVRALADAEPRLAERLHPAVPVIAAEVVWAVRHEMARTVDDVLARRTRVLVLDARAAVAMAPAVARLMAAELGRDAAWQRQQVAAFEAIAAKYMLPGRLPAAAVA